MAGLAQLNGPAHENGLAGAVLTAASQPRFDDEFYLSPVALGGDASGDEVAAAFTESSFGQFYRITVRKSDTRVDKQSNEQSNDA